MPRFIDTGRDVVNLDHVLAIRRHRRRVEDPTTGRQWWDTDVTIEMVDGNELHTSTNIDVDLLTEDLIPASPGYFALKLWNPGTDGEFIERAPVVAWRTSDGSVAGAIALGYDGDASTIACPDGRVIEIYTAEFESVDAWSEREQQSAIELTRAKS